MLSMCCGVCVLPSLLLCLDQQLPSILLRLNLDQLFSNVLLPIYLE
jgi:hypothetical protein